MRRQHPHSFLALAITLAALVAGACGPGAPAAQIPTAAPQTPTAAPQTPTSAPQIPEVTVTATDFALDMPERVPTGVVRVTLDNRGKLTHNLLLARLKETRTVDEIKATILAKGPAGLAAISDFYGGATGTPAGERRQVIVDLADGPYAALSTAAFSDDKAPDFAKGMLRLASADSYAGSGKVVPEATLVVTYADAAPVKLSTTVRAGKQIWQVALDGKAPHTPIIAKLAPGKTADDLASWFKTRGGPVPADFVGGMHSLSPGGRGWIVLDLGPGDYVVLDSLGAQSDSQPISFTLR